MWPRTAPARPGHPSTNMRSGQRVRDAPSAISVGPSIRWRERVRRRRATPTPGSSAVPPGATRSPRRRAAEQPVSVPVRARRGVRRRQGASAMPRSGKAPDRPPVLGGPHGEALPRPVRRENGMRLDAAVGVDLGPEEEAAALRRVDVDDEEAGTLAGEQAGDLHPARRQHLWRPGRERRPERAVAVQHHRVEHLDRDVEPRLAPLLPGAGRAGLRRDKSRVCPETPATTLAE